MSSLLSNMKKVTLIKKTKNKTWHSFIKMKVSLGNQEKVAIKNIMVLKYKQCRFTLKSYVKITLVMIVLIISLASFFVEALFNT